MSVLLKQTIISLAAEVELLRSKANEYDDCSDINVAKFAAGISRVTDQLIDVTEKYVQSAKEGFTDDNFSEDVLTLEDVKAIAFTTDMQLMLDELLAAGVTDPKQLIKILSLHQRAR